MEIQGQVLFSEIRQLIELARSQAFQQVNSLQTRLYWQIGERVQKEILKSDRASYGKQVVQQLSEELQKDFGKGFGKRNLYRMLAFYNAFPDQEIVSTLWSQLTWSHFRLLVAVDEPLKREFYLKMCQNERWSVRRLQERMDSMLFERTAIAKKPEETIRRDLQKLENEKSMSTDLAFRDPYLLDFLGLKDSYSESELEDAILQDIQSFIMELGSDFAFLARQKRMSIGHEDFYLDLLFFHRKMQRLVAIDLKLGSFKHGYKSQMELYLNWLAKYEKQPHEKSPIGLILCADKNQEMVELLEMDKQGIHVARYHTELPPKALLQEKLHEAITKARKKSTSDEGS
ncbi:DUF1016 domain-containing protein (plasmid) [Fulvitalea axinellae]|uniref:DUF1016 domain-containing protein n=1 Tax=Fulvitalea axinellae TaxID=1182444 RepID=A0AAU9D2A9_9BACT|nr:DUF1016 domain-containing protein [Fulvitalea axinellae]